MIQISNLKQHDLREGAMEVSYGRDGTMSCYVSTLERSEIFC